MATSKPMSIITIGLDTFVMPADAALKVMQLMQQQARTCQFDTLAGADQVFVYSVGDCPRLSVENVNPNNLRMPETPSRSPRTRTRKE